MNPIHQELTIEAHVDLVGSHFQVDTDVVGIEARLILQNEHLVESAIVPARRLLRYFEINRELPAQFDVEWKKKASFFCLTGCAQLALIFQRIYQEIGDARYLDCALKINDVLKARQMKASKYPEIDGAIAGSYPFWADYLPYCFPNWAAKFFCDSLLLQIKCLSELRA